MNVTRAHARSRGFGIVLALTLIVSACGNVGQSAPSDPGGHGLQALCDMQATTANIKTDWATMSSATSDIEDSLAAADRIERSYVAGGQALGTIGQEHSLYASARYIKTVLASLASIFSKFKHSIVYQSKAEQDAAIADYTVVYDKILNDIPNGNFPGGEAYTAIAGYNYSSCASVATTYTPAVSNISIDSPQNREACKSSAGSYSFNDLFLEVRAIDWEVLVPGDEVSLESIQSFGTKMQPALASSSGSLLFGMARAVSGLMTLHEAAMQSNLDAMKTAADIFAEGGQLGRAACHEIGVELD